MSRIQHDILEKRRERRMSMLPWYSCRICPSRLRIRSLSSLWGTCRLWLGKSGQKLSWPRLLTRRRCRRIRNLAHQGRKQHARGQGNPNAPMTCLIKSSSCYQVGTNFQFSFSQVKLKMQTEQKRRHKPERILHVFNDFRGSNFFADFSDTFSENLSVLRIDDRLDGSAQNPDLVFPEDTSPLEFDSAVKSSLTTECQKNTVGSFALKHLHF